MAKYKAFISYRKSHDTSADLVKKALVEEYGFAANEIFLDKHDIGPEYFDTKLKTAVESSSSLVLIVTKDCFVPKNEDEDWYLEEIQTALDNGITIIPLLFDGIKSLNDKTTRAQLGKSFCDDEISKIIKTQAIPYDFDLSDATFSKLSKFIHNADKPDTLNKVLRTAKGISIVLALFAIVFCLFVGIGFLWGYLSSERSTEDILMDNTHIEGNAAIFEFGGLEAKYDLDQDTICIDLQNFTGKLPQSDLEILAHSCSVSGAIVLFNKNVSAIRYFKFLKGGSKQSKIALAGVTAAAAIGSICGFSQGSKWGRTLKQQNEAMKLFPLLKNKDLWAPVFADHIFLRMKYNKARAKGLPLSAFLKVQNNALKSRNTLTWCFPFAESSSIARDAGLRTYSIVCKFNDWEIGSGTPESLSMEIEKAGQTTKDIVVLEIDSLHHEIKHMILPSGTVGIGFNYPTQTSDISHALKIYSDWKSANGQ